jgi:hypothetical protein
MRIPLFNFAADPDSDPTFDEDPDTSYHFDTDAFPDPAPAPCQSDANLRPIVFSPYSHGFILSANLRPIVFSPYSHGFILSLFGPLCAVHGPPWLYFSPPQLVNFYFDADPD